ncbi:HAD hydrolase-like protein (plasmid) [Chromobacterium amazonense]|uniref:HAD family hydrolase n=1 Tax=Chromobacterium amazonense TaxID=1382803 RepID=UPI00237ED49E|nr:HAD hydrolase-like protein [Chromobacterium amazonense]MDE1712722.1 HAD hydrolase-like protein [Chromobacterium amazonense]
MNAKADFCLLFDLDGTLTHTDDLHFDAFATLMAEHGRALDHDTFLRHIVGATNEAIMARLFPDLPSSSRWMTTAACASSCLPAPSAACSS